MVLREFALDAFFTVLKLKVKEELMHRQGTLVFKDNSAGDPIQDDAEQTKVVISNTVTDDQLNKERVERDAFIRKMVEVRHR